MRVLRLDLSGSAVDLHPFVTVARGLAPSTRAELVGVLAGIPAGRAPVSGLIEAHGVLLDLDPTNLAMLDLAAELPVVVVADDLPGAPLPETPRLATARAATRDADEALAESEAALERAESSLDAARRALAAATDDGVDGTDSLAEPRAAVAAAAHMRAEAEDDVEHAAADLAAAEQELLAAEVDANHARDARAAATRAMSVAAAALDAAADRRDPVAIAAVETARHRVAAAEAGLAAARAGEELAVPQPDGRNLEALRAERFEVEAAVLALETPDPFPVRLALEQVAADDGPVELETPREAIILADRWAAITAEIDALQDRAAADGERRAQALKRIRAAQEAVDDAEVGQRPGVEPAAVVVLEAAHADVLAARDAADRRLGGRNARRRLDEALAEERKVLDRLGLRTYADYLMGTPGTQDVAEEPDRLANARQELIDAEAALRRLDADAHGELRRAELLHERRALRAAAVDLLDADPGDDVESALRRHRVPAPGRLGGARRLSQSLEAAGLVIGDEEMPVRFLVDLAKVWLDEQELVVAQRRKLEERVAELDVRIADRQRAEAEPELAQRPPLTQAVAALEEAKAALRHAEARAARHATSEAEVQDRREAFEIATRSEAAAVVVVGEAEAVVIRLDEDRRRAARELDAAQTRLEHAGQAEAQAAAALVALEAQIAAAVANGFHELEDEVATCEAAATEARAEVTERARAAGEARADLVVVEADEAAAGQVASADAAQAAVEDTEWYLLARLAAQRAVSYAGSVPLVLDDALGRLDSMSARDLLDRLERMAATVQVVVVTEDLAAAAWATQLGPERAAVVEVGASV